MEATQMQTRETASAAPVITPGALLEHWQGHRRLTRRVIEAFPKEAFFNYALGGMRPFAALAMEMIGMAGPSMVGVATRDLLYFIDNEVHHRGQGYVYLRALGIEPPPFWERD